MLLFHIGVLDALLRQHSIRFDLSKAIKQSSLASEPNASRTRAAKSQAVADELSRSVFPITAAKNISVTLQPTGAAISRSPESVSALHAASIAEPVVEFHHRQESPDIRDGITRFGAYDTEPHSVELVPLCAADTRGQMAALIERLKSGKYKYKGAERTFSTRFSYSSIVTAADVPSLHAECGRVLSEHPDWLGNAALNRLFLIYAPEQGYSLDDENSPYYRLKRLMLEAGIPCQMVDSPTLLNPDWKDLNLALNIIAKCGVVPWVLPDRMPDADFFVGLSYTQSNKHGSTRMMGYANVFNAYGRWGFYSANSEAFPYDMKRKPSIFTSLSNQHSNNCRHFQKRPRSISTTLRNFREMIEQRFLKRRGLCDPRGRTHSCGSTRNTTFAFTTEQAKVTAV